MKKVAFIMVGLLAMMLAGCGEGSSSASGSSAVEGSSVVDVTNNGDVSKTTITNEFGLNPALGTPPPLPAS